MGAGILLAKRFQSENKAIENNYLLWKLSGTNKKNVTFHENLLERLLVMVILTQTPLSAQYFTKSCHGGSQFAPNVGDYHLYNYFLCS